ALPAHVDAAALAQALDALGARAVRFSDVADGRGRRAVQVHALLRGPAVDDASAVLWRAGAADVLTRWTEVHSPALVEVTVPVGRGRTRAAVRVRAWKGSDAELVRVAPDDDDVSAAAAQQRRAAQAVAADAVAALSRLTEQSGDEDEDG
ncbi:MAG TPA: hypothetical protein VGO62_06845, partial [Myxococcota bacterium]